MDLKHSLLRSLFIGFFLCHTPCLASATHITTLQDTPLSVSSNDEVITIRDDGSIEVDTDADDAAIKNGSFANTTIILDTNLSSDGIIATGNTAGAILFDGAGATLSGLTITSGTVSSQNTSDSDGTINLHGDNSTPTINVGNNTGASGTITNTGTGGNAIYSVNGATTDLTINNNVTGTISSEGNAIQLEDAFAGSSLRLSNAGTISAASGHYAILLTGYVGDITNNGTITGNVDLGNSANSVMTVTNGTISGGITMGDASQNVIFNGGNLDDGTINGRGIVRVDVDTVLNGSIGNESPLDLLTISDDADFSLANAAYSASVGKIEIGSGASFTSGYTAVSTDEVDGLSANSGTLALNMQDNSDITISTQLGTTNGLEAVQISGNLIDGSKGSTVTMDTNITALTTTIKGIGSVFNLSSSYVITGDVVIGDQTRLQLDDQSSVTGTIKGIAQYKGVLVIRNSYLDPDAVSGVTLENDIGGDGKNLASIVAGYKTSIDAATYDVEMYASNIYLSHLASLTLGTGSASGTIKGFAASGSSNGLGSVIFAGNNTLAGDVGTSDGNALNSVTLNSGVEVTGGSYEMNTATMSIGNGSTLTTSGFISAGDNDNSGATHKDMAITMSTNSSLELGSGASIYGSINSSGTGTSLSIDTTLNSTNSHLTIGNSTQLASITLHDATTLDVTGNNGAVKAGAILLGSGATLKLGNTEIVGSIDGLLGGNSGIVDIQGTVTLDGAVGATNSLAIFNVGTQGMDGYSVTALDAIAATSITVNGVSTVLSIADEKTLTGNVVLSDDSTLSLGDASTVNGTITGSSNTETAGQLIIRNNAAIATSGNIGEGGFDLSSVTLQDGSALDLSVNNNSLNASSVRIASDATLTIGSASVAGNIQGYNSLGDSSYGLGKVVFANNNTVGGNVGLEDEAALENVTINAGAGVVTGTYGINAIDIVLNAEATLTTAGSITGGVSLEGEPTSDTTISLAADATFILNNGASVIGTINAVSANDAGIGTVKIATGGTTTLNGDIGNRFKIKTLTIENGATLDASTHPGSINAASITVGTGSTLSLTSVSDAGGDFGLRGVVDGSGTLNLAASSTSSTYDLTATLGSIGTLDAVHFTLDTSYVNVTHSIKADTVTLAGTGISALALAEDTDISGDVILGNNKILNLKDGAFVSGSIKGAADNNGTLTVGTSLFGSGGASATIMANDAIGDSTHRLQGVELKDNATFDLATHTVDVNAYDLSLGTNSILTIGDGSVSAVNDVVMSEGAAITIESGSLTADNVLMATGSSITVVDGAIDADVRGDGDVTYTSDNTLQGVLGITSVNDAQLHSLILSNGIALTSDYEIAASNINIGSSTLTTTGKISGGFNGTSTLASAITLASSAVLQIDGSTSVTATINGSGSGNGRLEIFGAIGGNINIGNTTKISEISIDNESTLDVSANNNTVNATDITLASSATLTVGTTTLQSAINGLRDDYGTLTIAASKTTTTNGNIGASEHLLAINIESGATLDISAHGNSLNAVTTTLGDGATLKVGSGVITGSFIGNADGNGTINFTANKTIDNTVELGTDGHALDTLEISSGVHLTVNDNPVYSNHTIIGSLGRLSLVNAGVINIGAINGNAGNLGTFSFSGGGLLTLDGDIGSTHSLSEIYLGENSALNAFTSGTSVIAADIYLASGSTITMSGGSLSGTVHGSGGDDSIAFSGGENHTLSANLGVDSDDDGIGSVSIQSTLNTNTHGIRTDNFIFDSDSAIINFSSGYIDITDFTNNHPGNGIMNFSASNNINFTIDEDNAISELTIADGATVNDNQTVYATDTTIGSGTSGKLIIASDQTLHSDIRINNGGNLTLNNHSAVSGNITGSSSSGSGTVEISASSSSTIAGDIGTADHKISTITLNAGSSLDMGTHSVVASSISLDSGSSLQVESGTINAQVLSSSDSHNYGTLTFAADNALLHDVGSTSRKILSLTIDDEMSLTAGSHKIYANTVLLGNHSEIILQDGSAISNNIKGTSDGNGDISASGTVSIGSIGDGGAVNTITSAALSHVTFGGNVNAVGSMNINGDAIFPGSTTTVTTASFNANSGSTLSFLINTSSPPESVLSIVGAATISDNTSLNLTVSGTATSGMVITLIDASEASTIAAISHEKINLNNSGTNIYHGQTYTTSVLGNKLLLTLAGDTTGEEGTPDEPGEVTPDTPARIFSNSDSQHIYDAIIRVAEASGPLKTLQDYLTDPAIANTQKEIVVKSVSPQTDNANNISVFNATSASMSVISNRLESFYNPSEDTALGVASGDKKNATNIWVQEFGNMIDQNDTLDFDGYRSRSIGTVIGADHEVFDDLIIGMSGSYSDSSIKANDALKETQIDTYQGNIYGRYIEDNYFVNGMLGIAWNEYTSKRSILIANSRASATYSGQSYIGRIESGLDQPLHYGLTLTPRGILTLAQNRVNNYEESGAGNLNLAIHNNRSHFFETRLAATLSRHFLTAQGTNITPDMTISYGYDFAATRQVTNSRFIGQSSSFESTGSKIVQGSWRMGSGLKIYCTEAVALKANYDFDYKDNYYGHTGSVELKYSF